MDIGIQLGTNQRLEQNLSPQLRQFVTILQKNSLELDTAIKEELESNPLLELDDAAPMEEREVHEDELPDSGAELREAKDNFDDYDSGDYSSLEDSAMGDSSLLDGGDDINYEQYLKDGSMNEDAPFKDLNVGNDSDDEWDRPIKDHGKSLQDKLRDQLLLWSGSREQLEQLARSNCSEKKFRSLVEYLIDSLDENGFLQEVSAEVTPLRVSEDPLINEIESMLRDEVPLEECSLPVREAVHVLQGFNPRGIGARNQRECFLIQAYAIPNFPPLGIKILENCYEDLLALRYAKIGKSLGVSTEDVQRAVASFAKLNPHPGFQLSNSRVQTIAADLKVVDKHGRMEVESVRSSMQKRLRVRDHTPLQLFVQKRVLQGVLLALLPGLQNFSAPAFLQVNSAAFAAFKILFGENTIVYQRKDKTICHAGTKLLHQIQCERCASRPVSVQKAYIGIQTHALQSGGAVVCQQRIGKAERRVDRIQRRSAASSVKPEAIPVLQDHVVKCPEISGRRCSF